MSRLTKLVLDVLKPHQPNSLDFARLLAESAEGMVVHLEMVEMDEKTHSLRLTFTGEHLDFEAIEKAIDEQGASLHSIDVVEYRTTE
ncbi:DUF211 domain-containing protein [Saccharospirillum salsuginis]|uniref:DUF211 domain-containing protein n=1 Tax=Saccharospirillum salsuginis TaxID=418750 RepID=A0A918K2X8_9GAMM|nr:DUF211 domain-containing protein [Saccharospirillum salsuginis]GGX47130.1 hypothetical protein GCM10007392_12420 [Saccharospirillum salsuginis]